MLYFSEAVWLAFFTSSVAALSFYIVYAAGQLNVAQPGFMAMGAYAVALSTGSETFPLWAGVLVGFGLVTIVAWLLARVTVRLGGVYLAMATLAFVIVVQQLIVITPAVGGAVGIHGIPRMLGIPQAAAVLIFLGLVLSRVMKSRLGFEMRTAREDEVAARAIGVDLRSLRMRTAILSAWVAALAGGMEALHTSFVGPGDFGFVTLITLLGIAIVGGTDRWWGPVFGAVVLSVLPELTRASQWREILAGVLILGVIIVFPEGLVGAVLRIRRAWQRRRRGHPGPTRPAPVAVPRGDGPESLEDAREASP